jgi:hypothetical protein
MCAVLTDYSQGSLIKDTIYSEHNYGHALE